MEPEGTFLQSLSRPGEHLSFLGFGVFEVVLGFRGLGFRGLGFRVFA